MKRKQLANADVLKTKEFIKKSQIQSRDWGVIVKAI